MNAVGFAWRSLVRQPARAALGVLGVAAVGALLLDMLMLSQGLIVSMRDLLDQGGWDVRVSAGELPRTSGRMSDASAAAVAIAELPAVRSVLLIRLAEARLEREGRRPMRVSFEGVRRYGSGDDAPAVNWVITRGRDAAGADEVVVNETIAGILALEPGDELPLRASCLADLDAVPSTRVRVAGVATFPFESTGENTVGGTIEALARACGGDTGDNADLFLVSARGDPGVTTAAIETILPHLHAATNDEVVGRLQETGFTYFRQISTVLTTVTVSFAVLLIAVLLTVSVNQRLGEVAALRALGFTRARVVKDVLSESALIVGSGGALSLPLGLLLAAGLDRILKDIPGIPASLHFFVFERQALVVHLVLLAATTLLAAAYPMRIVSRLPIAATLRDEVIG